MMTPGSANALLLADAGYQVQRSVRLRSSASASFTKSLSSNGSLTTWTWSAWVKRGAIGNSTYRGLFGAGANSGNPAPLDILRFTDVDTLQLALGTSNVANTALITTQVFRDPSAWYHIVAVYDSSNATSSSRARLYINGLQVTAFGTATYPSQNTQTSAINVASATTQVVGAQYFGASGGVALPFDGYLTEVNFIDGQALTPASFGEINPVTGVWAAKKYAGTYGTNGFYLNFSDPSAATAAAIGKDSSGNGNNWTPANVSVTAGVTYDSMLDVPLGAGGAERGNYAVLNPLDNSQGAGIISDGNLKISYNASGRAIGTVFTDSGKWYAEFTVGQVSTATNADAVGVCGVGTTSSVLRGYAPNGQYYNGSAWASYGATYTAGDVIGVAVDVGSQTLEFFKNNANQGQKTSIGVSTLAFLAWAQGASGNNIAANFGQRPFAYTPPTGFKALHTGNLPDAVIKLPAQYMAATTWTGNGSTQSISNAVNGVSFQPDLLWTKGRSAAWGNFIHDSVRGFDATPSSRLLLTDSTSAELTTSPALVSAFTTSGFTVGANGNSNANANTYVGWQWKANGAAVTNTSGFISSQVNAGTSQGFSVVTYTGTGANATVGHGLGVAPKMVIVKKRTGTIGAGFSNWPTYHASVGATNIVYLDATSAAGSTPNAFNSTAPTSSVLSVGTNTLTNESAATYVAYCFSEVAGFSKFGSYTGNGSADGPFVFCGFRPRYLMAKRTDSTGDWRIIDTSRDTYNAAINILRAQDSIAEGGSLVGDILSGGFKIRTTDVQLNASGGTYIFMAFAESPFKNSLAR